MNANIRSTITGNRQPATGKLRNAIVLALLAGATTATGHTFAQDGDATTLDRVAVTGSRIRSVDVETQQPIFVLTREAIQQTGRASVADVLQQIATNGAAINTQFNNGGDGSSGIDLRNLGASRTLVLVNGRRWVQQLQGDVDLNTVPSAMIERIEILKDGASTIYGSDAIAGVVNLITRENFTGGEAHVYYGEFSQGDGEREIYDITLGSSDERSNVVFGASYVKENGVSAGARKISRVPQFGVDNPITEFSGFSASGRIWDLLDENGVPTDDIGQLAGLASWIVNPGADGRDMANYHAFTDADRHNYAADNYLLTPQERKSLFFQGRYDLTERISIRSDAVYNQRNSAQQLAGFPLSAGSFLGGDQGLLASSYYNPTANTNNPRELNWSKRLVEQERFYEQDVKTFHWYGGLEGTFDLGGRFFSWDAGFNYNLTDRTDTQIGDVNMGNLYLATGASFLDTDGVVKCGTPGAEIVGCVPFNPFVGPGGVTQEQLDYLLFTAKDTYQNKSRSITANISGEIVELPAGMLAFAAGLEHRKESGYDNPDAFVSAGMSSGNARQPTSGAYDLDDAYLELAVPLLRDLPGAEQLELSLATRYSDYSNFGSTTNHKAGFKWKPFADLMVRGNWSEGFRAPSIDNMYAGAGASFDTYGDPCSSDSPYYGTPAVAARCQAAGIPAGYTQFSGYGSQANRPFDWTSNPELQPETSISKTLGFVYSPSWARGLNVSLDWWKIKLDSVILRPTATYMLNQCYVEGNDGWCTVVANSGIERNILGQITYLARSLQNLGAREVEGYDLTVRYSLPDTRIGSFAFVWDSVYMDMHRTKATPESEWDPSEVGLYSQSSPVWRIRSNLNARWTYGNFGATWTTRYFSSMEESCGAYRSVPALCNDPNRVTENGPSPRHHIGATTYHDLQLRYNAPWNGTVSVGVNNLFAKEPPVSVQAFANSFDPQYDTPGRYYYMEYRHRF